VEGDAAQDALSQLVAYSVLQWDESMARYRLHDLVRVFADARLGSADRDAARKRHAEHFETVLRGANKLYMAWKEGVAQGLKLVDLEVENIKAGQAWAAAHAEEDPTTATLCSDYPVAGVYLLYLRQHPRNQISWREAALDAARHLKDRRAEGAHLGNLGLAYWGLGDARRAIEYYEQSLVILREIGDRRGEGNALGSLGKAYRNLGKRRRAIGCFQQQLSITRIIKDRRGEGYALSGLGLVYRDRARPAVESSTTGNTSLSPARSAIGVARATRSATWATLTGI